MALNRELECEIWCPSCHMYYAAVYRVQTREGHWEHEREPKHGPSICTVCGTVLERH